MSYIFQITPIWETRDFWTVICEFLSEDRRYLSIFRNIHNHVISIVVWFFKVLNHIYFPYYIILNQICQICDVFSCPVWNTIPYFLLHWVVLYFRLKVLNSCSEILCCTSLWSDDIIFPKGIVISSVISDTRISENSNPSMSFQLWFCLFMFLFFFGYINSGSTNENLFLNHQYWLGIFHWTVFIESEYNFVVFWKFECYFLNLTIFYLFHIGSFLYNLSSFLRWLVMVFKYVILPSLIIFLGI